MQEITYKYTMQKINEFIELYQYLILKYNESDDLFDIDSPVRIIKTDFIRSNVYLLDYMYGEKPLITSLHCSNSTANYANFKSVDNFRIASTPVNTTDFELSSLSNSFNKSTHPVLRNDELTEEMFEQLKFMYTDDVIYCAFFISTFIHLGYDISYDTEGTDLVQVLKELKEYFNE